MPSWGGFAILGLRFVIGAICQWSVVSGQWSVVSGQWSVVSGEGRRRRDGVSDAVGRQFLFTREKAPRHRRNPKAGAIQESLSIHTRSTEHAAAPETGALRDRIAIRPSADLCSRLK